MAANSIPLNGFEQMVRKLSQITPSKSSAPNLAALRDQLATELAEINSTEEAATWAHRVLGAKNSLTAADAAYIEETFRTKLTIFAIDSSDSPAKTQETERPRAQRTHRGKKQRRSGVIDK